MLIMFPFGRTHPIILSCVCVEDGVTEILKNIAVPVVRTALQNGIDGAPRSASCPRNCSPQANKLRHAAAQPNFFDMESPKCS